MWIVGGDGGGAGESHFVYVYVCDVAGNLAGTGVTVQTVVRGAISQSAALLMVGMKLAFLTCVEYV